MASNSSTVSTGKQRNKSGGVHNTLVYVKQHWELYVIFLLPALALTLIFADADFLICADERYPDCFPGL